MKIILAALAITITLLAAGPRKTIFLDKMDGFETYVEQAFKEKEINIEVLTEEAHPDLKAILGKRFKSVYAEALYRKQTGRTEDTEIKLIDVNTGKTLLVHQFKMGTDDSGKRRAAAGFADALKKKLAE